MSYVAAFDSAKQVFDNLDAQTAATVIAAASDISLVLSEAGVIVDAAFHSQELADALQAQGSWLTRRWPETVTAESRGKIHNLLNEVGASATRWRQVNHPLAGSPDIPVLYSAVRIAADRIVVFGRDLRPIAALQQRLVEAQQAMERDYARLRHVETRYRMLFHLSSEPVLVVDAASDVVVEANPAAGHALGVDSARLVGKSFTGLFAPQSAGPVSVLLGGVRAAGRGDDIMAHLRTEPDATEPGATEPGATELRVSAALFRQDNAAFFLVRLLDGAPLPQRGASEVEHLVEAGPDGFVVTTPDGTITSANPAFLEMAQLTAEEQARGESLDRWLGRPATDLPVLLANLRGNGAVRLFATEVRGEYGAVAPVEIAAGSAVMAGRTCFGFIIRITGRRPVATTRAGRELPRSIEQLTELIGRVALKDMVRETTDVIERLCIEAALELTGDNRASAAELLGLSRQSLYVKLRRYGMGDLADKAEG